MEKNDNLVKIKKVTFEFEDSGFFKWNINDGQPHVIEITTTNNADNTAVEVVVTIDGEEVARVVDDGTKQKPGKDRPTLYPEAGNLVVRAKWMDITVG